MKINSTEFINISNELNIKFEKFCTLSIIPDKVGAFGYSPQLRYKNIKNYPYLTGIDENTVFCKFKPNLPNVKGVYLWVLNGEIIYIGEGVNLRDRFNNGYGNISPRNCFKGGQSTNVKMNRIVFCHYENNQHIDIYLCETSEHKQIEFMLLKKIKTKYNIQNNV